MIFGSKLGGERISKLIRQHGILAGSISSERQVTRKQTKIRQPGSMSHVERESIQQLHTEDSVLKDLYITAVLNDLALCTNNSFIHCKNGQKISHTKKK